MKSLSRANDEERGPVDMHRVLELSINMTWNEIRHRANLVRDFGDLNLALAAVTLVALLAFTRWVVLAAALAWIVYQTPHLIYHLRHLDLYDTSDKVGNVTALVLALILPIVVLFGARRLRPG